VDLVVDLPRSQEGHNAICVFVCHLSKMVRLIATTTELTTEGFARLFMKEVFPHYGFPVQIVADRGTQWNSEFFRALCKRAGVSLTLSTAFHPQTNGLTERTNEVVEAALRHYVSADMSDWDEMLPLIEFALNSAHHEAIQSTPFRMNRICLPANPFDVLISNSQARTSEQAGWMGLTPFAHGERTIMQAHEEFHRARRCVHAAKSRMKDRHDGKGICLHLYEVGHLVWFNIKNIGLRHDSRRHKLLPKFWGPFKIIELVGRNAVRLDMPSHLERVHPVVSVSLIKPYRGRAGEQAPTPITRGTDIEFEVDDIVDFNLVNSKRKNIPSVVEFRVRWKDCSHDSWHEPKDFAHAQDLLQGYLQRLSKTDRKRVLKAFDPDSLALLPDSLRNNLSKQVQFAAGTLVLG